MNGLLQTTKTGLRLLLIGGFILTGPSFAGGPTDDDDNDGVVNNLDNCVITLNASQIDTDGDGWGNRCDPDYNNDGVVNVIDLGILKLAFFSSDPNVDLNSDGIVNVIDLGLLKTFFFLGAGPAGYANWVNPGDGDWEIAANWFPAVVPPAEAHVSINQVAPITVSFPRADGNLSADFSAASIVTSNDIVIRVGSLTVGGDVTSTAALSATGGRLDVSGDLTVEGALTLSGATLANATIQQNANSDPVTPVGTANTFENISLGTDLILNSGARLTSTNDLTLAGGDIFLLSDNNFTDLRFNGTQTLGGTGSVHFAGTATVDDRNRIYTQALGQTTIASTITIRTDTSGGRVGIPNAGAFVMRATVISDLPGRAILFGGTQTIDGPVSGSGGGELRFDDVWSNLAGNTISMVDGVLELFGEWMNFGTITATNSTLIVGTNAVDAWTNDGTITLVNTPADIGGSFNLAQLTSITTDSPVNIDGSLDNTGTNLDVDGFPNGITLIGGGTITGGIISGTGGLPVVGTNANVDGVTLATDITLTSGARLDVINGLTLVGSDIILASNNAFTDLRFEGTQTLGGTGSVRFAGTATVDDRNRIYAQAAGQVLTIGSNVTIKTDTTGGRLGIVNLGDIVLQGSVISDLAAREIRISGTSTATTTIGGPVTGSGGGDLRLEGVWTNLAGNTISMTGGGVLALWGDWINLGTILSTNSIADFGNTFNDDWTNSGTITLVNTPLDAGGSYDLARLLSITTDSAVDIDGNLDNTGTNLNVDVFTSGITLVSGGTIIGGTVSGTGGFVASGQNANLDGVTLATDVTVNAGARLDVLNGLTLASGDIILASNNNFTDLRFDGSQTLGGAGSVRFAGTTTVDDRNRVYAQASGQVLTIGSNVTVETDTTGGRIGILNLGDIELQGSVVSDVSGRNIRITGTTTGTTTIGGPVTGSGGGGLRLEGGWTNLAGNTISMTGGGVLELWGDWINQGTILGTNSTLDFGNTLNDDWTNNGTIMLVNTPFEAGGSYNLAQLLSITTDSAVDINGDLDNTGTNLDVDDFTSGITLVSGGTIIGGTISGTGGLSVTGTNADLDGVTLATDVTINAGARLDVENGLTLASSDIILASDNNFTDLRFDGSQTLGGSGNIRFGGSATVDDRNRVYAAAAGQILTIGSGVTVQTDTTGGRLGLANTETILQGALISDLANRAVQLLGDPITLEGNISIGEQSSVDLISNSQFEMTAAAAIDIDIGPANHGTMSFNDSAAFDGDLNLALVNGASPSGCDLFTVFGYESFSGAFDAVTGPHFGGGQTFELILLEDIGQLQTPGTGCTYEVSRITGNTETASTESAGNVAPRGNDNAAGTYWCALAADPAPQLIVQLPADATVYTIEVDNALGTANQFTTGRVRLLNAADTEIYNSGVVALVNGDLSLDVSPDTALTRKIVFEGVTWGGNPPCIGELDALGTQP